MVTKQGNLAVNLAKARLLKTLPNAMLGSSLAAVRLPSWTNDGGIIVSEF